MGLFSSVLGGVTGGVFGAGLGAFADKGTDDKLMGVFDPGGLLKGQGASPGSEFMGKPDINQFGNSPLHDSISGQVDNLKNFKYDAYKAKDMSNSALPQYDAMRSRLDRQYSQSQGQAQDALDRQFAAAGGGPGNGAQAKQTENLAADVNRQKSSDLEGINQQEAQTRFGLQQAEAQKEFQSQEAGKGYGFQAQQAGLQGQMGLGQMDLGYQQAQAESRNNEFNKVMAQHQAAHSGGLLGGGGFLGTGMFQNGIGG